MKKLWRYARQAVKWYCASASVDLDSLTPDLWLALSFTQIHDLVLRATNRITT